MSRLTRRRRRPMPKRKLYTPMAPSAKRSKYATRRRRVYRRRRAAPTSRSAIARIAKQVVMKTTETQQKNYNHDNSLGYYHNELYASQTCWSSTNHQIFPAQGDHDNERKGDQIDAIGIKMRMVLTVPSDRKNSIIKMWFCPYNSIQNIPTKTTFLNSVSGNVLLDDFERDRYPGTQFLGTFRVQARDLATTQDSTILIKKWIPLKRKIKFIGDDTSVPSNLPENGVLVVTVYDTIGTLGTDRLIEASEINWTLYYKDP